MVELIVAVIAIAGCIYYIKRQQEKMSQKTINGLFIVALIALTAVIAVIQQRIEKASIDRAMKQELIDLVNKQHQISKGQSQLIKETLEHSREVLDHLRNHSEKHQTIVDTQKEIVAKVDAINKRLETVSTYVSLDEGKEDDLSNTNR